MNEVAGERRLLPLGSVVVLEGCGDCPFMGYGRMLADAEGEVWDYLLCAHPEGLMPYGDLRGHWFANREHVARLLFIGYSGGREGEFRAFLESDAEGGGVWDM